MLSSLFTEYNYCFKIKSATGFERVKEQFPMIISIQENDYAFYLWIFLTKIN